MSSSIVIPSRFRGPERAGNGGYVAGLLARELGGEVEVSIRRPVPLDRPLALRRDAQGSLALLDGELVLAQATPPQSERRFVVPKIGIEEAAAATRRFPRFVDHPVPGCFVCGHERAEGDGLRIFPGPTEAEPAVWAAPWTPHPTLADASGNVREELAWAALDCAGAFAVNEPPRGLALLGRITARVLGPIPAGRTVVVVAWELGREGRKLYPATALLDGDGSVLARAHATWILT